MRSLRSGPDPVPVEKGSPSGYPEHEDPRLAGSAGAKSAGQNVNTPGPRASNLEVRRAEAEEDRGLIEAAQWGDRAAFRRLVERHQRRVFVIVLGMVRDENDACDLVQEAFLQIGRAHV